MQCSYGRPSRRGSSRDRNSTLIRLVVAVNLETLCEHPRRQQRKAIACNAAPGAATSLIACSACAVRAAPYAFPFQRPTLAMLRRIHNARFDRRQKPLRQVRACCCEARLFCQTSSGFFWVPGRGLRKALDNRIGRQMTGYMQLGIRPPERPI
jgi:hypothetical protein